MTTIQKPLDLAQFELQYPRYVYRSHKGAKSLQWHEAALDFEAECRAQREQIKALREALEEAANDLRRHDAHQSEAEARAVLAATQGDA